jgi:sortase A
MRVMRVVCVVVLIAGLALTGRAAYVHAKGELARVLIQRAWKESVRTGEARKPWRWADLHPVAQLKISRLKYDEYVLDNASPRTLAFGPGVVGNGVSVGKTGNLVIAGHRTSWFLPLEKITSGDRIELEWLDAGRGELRTREYRVERIAVTEPTDVSLLRGGEDDALTLITCYPFGYAAGSPQRFVVRAVPVGASVESAKLGN